MAQYYDFVQRRIQELTKDAALHHVKREVADLHNILDENENILGVISGIVLTDTWLITATDKRLLFTYQSMFGKKKSEELLFSQIQALSKRNRWGLVELTLTVNGEDKQIKGIASTLVPQFIKAIESLTGLSLPADPFTDTTIRQNDGCRIESLKMRKRLLKKLKEPYYKRLQFLLDCTALFFVFLAFTF